MAVELYYWLAYPDLRYGKTFKDIIFPRQGRAGILANSMTAPTVWPLLFVVPAAYGLFRSILKPRSLPSDLAVMLENVKKASADYQSSFWQDLLIWYLFPKHNLKSRIRDAETHLLLDGRSKPETRKEMLGVLQELVAQSKHETQLMAIQCLTELADSLGQRDIKRLIEAGVSKEELLNRLELKVSAMEILEELGRYHPSIIEPSKNKAVNLIAPIRRYIHAHYALWELGNPQNDLLQLIFWVQKGWRLYSKGALLLILIQAVQRIIERKRLERECYEAENVWLYMPKIEDYNCSVCGDLPVFYKDMFTIQDCMRGILSTPRNTSLLVAAFKRFGQRFPVNTTLDFRAQRGFTNENIPELMNAIGKYSKNVLNINMAVSRQDAFNANRTFIEMSDMAAESLASMVKKLSSLSTFNLYSCGGFGLGNRGSLALGKVLNETKIRTLNLGFNNIGDESAKVLAVGLVGSAVTSLDLQSNNIVAEGAKGLGAGLVGSRVTDLNLGFNHIGDEGAKGLGAGLVGSNLTSLGLSVNNIGADGAKGLGAGLVGSLLTDLNLFGNNIGAEGAKCLGVGLVGSRVTDLNLESNKIGDEGVINFAQTLLPTIFDQRELWIEKLDTSRHISISQQKSTAVITHINFANNINITDKGVAALCDVLPHTDLIPNNVSYFYFYTRNPNISATAVLCLNSRSSATGLRPPFPMLEIGRAFVFLKEGVYSSRFNSQNDLSSGASIALFLAMLVLLYNLCMKKNKKAPSLFFYKNNLSGDEKEIKQICSKGW